MTLFLRAPLFLIERRRFDPLKSKGVVKSTSASDVCNPALVVPYDRDV